MTEFLIVLTDDHGLVSGVVHPADALNPEITLQEIEEMDTPFDAQIVRAETFTEFFQWWKDVQEESVE